jgi:uncharacterized protein (TIGR02391 family)
MADGTVAEDVRADIALKVCRSFIDLRKPVSRRDLLLQFENRDLLDEMSTRGLLRENPNNRDCLPTAGSFALLGDEHELYLRARDAFAQMISALWRFYRLEYGQEEYQDEALWKSLAELPEPRVEMTREVFDLGLYLCEQFGVFAGYRHNAERTKIESFHLAELVVSMRDPMPWWDEGVRRSREQAQVTAGSVADYAPVVDVAFVPDSVWSLLNSAIAEEAMPRFKARLFADAVAAALKVVCREVRERTGLVEDGTALMNKAFSTRNPYLVFDDPIPTTKADMQQGYLQIFAGAMLAVRNPKAHGLVDIDERRCLHFLFLASLLADKVSEAIVCIPQ